MFFEPPLDLHDNDIETFLKFTCSASTWLVATSASPSATSLACFSIRWMIAATNPCTVATSFASPRIEIPLAMMSPVSTTTSCFH
jgi:hypothetical protein